MFQLTALKKKWTNSVPFQSLWEASIFFNFHPLPVKKDVFTLMSYFCKKTCKGACWMSGILLGNRTKKVSSSQSKMLAFQINGNLTSLYSQFSAVSLRGWSGVVRNGSVCLTPFSELLVQGSRKLEANTTLSSCPDLANSMSICISISHARRLPSCPAAFWMALSPKSVAISQDEMDSYLLEIH